MQKKYYRRYKIVSVTLILCIGFIILGLILARRYKKKKYQRLHEYKIEAALAKYEVIYR